MAARNDITGDSLVSRVTTDDYRNNYDAIFRKKPEPKPEEETSEVKPDDDTLT